jgi:hypothetical protein
MDPLGTRGPSQYLPMEEESSSYPEDDKPQYSSQAPIVEIPHSAINAVVDSFDQSISEYQKSSGDTEMGQDEGMSPEKAAWIQRHEDTRTPTIMVKEGPQNTAEGVGYEAFKYDLGGGVTAAVMGLKHSESGTELSALATHPGTQGAGKRMVEHAVNQSISEDNKLHLQSVQSAEGFYKSVGFERTAGKNQNLTANDMVHMHLNPKQSDKWSEEEDGTFTLNTQNDGAGRTSTKRVQNDQENPDRKRPRV